jgi:hypothetical protein
MSLPQASDDSSGGAEHLLALIETLPQNTVDIDTQPFHIRLTLGQRLRAENRGKIPLMLYWHPNLDRCASVCGVPLPLREEGMPTTASSGNGNGSAGASSSSLLTRVKESLFGKDASLPSTLTAPAVVKLLVPGAKSLQHVFLNAAVRAQLLTLASEHVTRLHAISFNKCWHEREKHLESQCATWDAHDRQMVLAFYTTRSVVPMAVNTHQIVEQIDAQHAGDDGLLRMFISLEFRRAFRDRLIAQTRQLHCKRPAPVLEKILAPAIATATNAATAADKPHPTNEASKSNSNGNSSKPSTACEDDDGEDAEDEWEWEASHATISDGSTSDADDPSVLQRAANNVVGGTVATAQSIVNGTRYTIDSVGRVTTASGIFVGSAVTSLFR